MCELYLNRPMFSGTSEMDQLNKLLSVLGYPYIYINILIWLEPSRRVNGQKEIGWLLRRD